MLMKYDLFADFYQKSSDSQSVYTVLLGTINTSSFNEIEKFGFQEDKDSTPGYLDYVMAVDEESVLDWAQDGYVGELMDVLDTRDQWDKILVRAMEVEVIDDYGNYPPRGLMICETFVRFEYSDLDQPVYFEDTTNLDSGFSVPMICLKRYFKVMTMMEVMEGLSHFGTGQHWSLDQLRRYFAPDMQ